MISNFLIRYQQEIVIKINEKKVTLRFANINLYPSLGDNSKTYDNKQQKLLENASIKVNSKT